MTSLAQIVAALSVTYNDQGVAMWLAARNRGLGSAAPIDVIARDPGGIERVADLVRAIGDADPQLFTVREDSPPHDEFKGHLCIRCIPGQGHEQPAAATDTRPRLNDCGFIGTYEEHRAMGCCPGPKPNPLAVLQRAARRAEGERDTVELSDYVYDHFPFGRCDQCLRPLPHTSAERSRCAGPN